MLKAATIYYSQVAFYRKHLQSFIAVLFTNISCHHQIQQICKKPAMISI